MTDIRVKRNDITLLDPVSEENPFPVEVVDNLTPGRMVIARSGVIVSTTAYTAGDAVGGLIVFPNMSRVMAGCGSIVSLTIIDLSDQGAALQLSLFNRPFTPTADNAAMAVSDADALNAIGQLIVATTDYTDFGGYQLATIRNQFLAYDCPDGNLYGQFQTSGTPTYALGGLHVRLAGLRD